MSWTTSSSEVSRNTPAEIFCLKSVLLHLHLLLYLLLYLLKPWLGNIVAAAAAPCLFSPSCCGSRVSEQA